MFYQVSREYQRGNEDYIAKFVNRSDAEAFLRMKHESDQLLKVQVIYRLYDRNQVIETLATDSSAAIFGAARESGVRSSGSGSSPTPFKRVPLPPGVPYSAVKDEGEKTQE